MPILLPQWKITPWNGYDHVEMTELTCDEANELRHERTARWVENGVVTPFTPAEARYHARRFIAENGEYNLVRLLAESYLANQETNVRFELARLAFIASMNGSEEHARTKAQMAEDIPSVRSDWTYALAWALFETSPRKETA